MTLIGTMRMNRKRLTKLMKSLTGREENSTIVWHETSQGKMAIIAYAVNTKSKGKKMILLLCTVPNLAIFGITRDEGKKKPASFKVYDFTNEGDRHHGPAHGCLYNCYKD